MGGALVYSACALSPVKQHDVPFYVDNMGSCVVKDKKNSKTYVCDVDGDTLVDTVQTILYHPGTTVGLSSFTFVLNSRGAINTFELPMIVFDEDCVSGIYKASPAKNDQSGCRLSDDLKALFQPEIDTLVRYFHSVPLHQHETPSVKAEKWVKI